MWALESSLLGRFELPPFPLFTTFLFQLSPPDLLLPGQFYFKRSVGPFVIINFGLTFFFAIGSLLLCFDTRRASLNLAHAYFGLLLLLVVAGTPVGLYQLKNNPQRVESFCGDRAQGHSFFSFCFYLFVHFFFSSAGCGEKEQNNLLTMSYVGGSAAVLLWIVLLTCLMRVVFVYLCAIER